MRGAPLAELLEHVLEGEPQLGDEVDAVFRRADRLRRRRIQGLLAAGTLTAAVIAAAGYLLTTTLIPRPAARTAPPAPEPSASVSPALAPAPDAVLAVLRPVIDGKDMTIEPRPPERGDGWRQYAVRDSAGTPRGTIEVAVYRIAEDLCFPVTASPGDCARTSWAPKGVEYVRYDDERDPGLQVHQTIARRISDGRTLAVMAAGEPGTGAAKGKPALSGKQVEDVATDQRMFDAFGPDEQCSGPAADACPAFRVPVPVED